MNLFPLPIDTVNGIDALKRTVDAETALRAAANDEWQRGVQHGPMRAAHDQAIANVVAAARALVAIQPSP